MLKTLLRIRISLISALLLCLFGAVVLFLPQMKLTAGQLALFSVNSFLFGYYFAPLLSAQKSRVAALITTIRQEQMVILDVLTQSHLLSDRIRHQLKIRLRVYLESILANDKVSADNRFYDELLYFIKQVKGEDAGVAGTIYDRICKTQANRDAMNNLFAAKVYSHEWLVATVLWGITLFFALQTDYGHNPFFGLMLVILATGLTLLMVIMVKFATLTHKEAKRMWQPLRDLLKNHFEDVTADEVQAMRHRINQA